MAITVIIRYSDDSMFGGDDPSIWDVPASYDKFEQMVTDAIAGYNPAWSVEFERGINDGVKVLCDTVDEYAQDHEIKTDAEDIMSRVWQSWDWAIYAE